MEPIKFFSLNKNKKSNDSQPDYRMSFKTGDSFVEAGACWIKKDKKGNSYLSCKLGDAWTDHPDKSHHKKGWQIVEEGTVAPISGKTAPGEELEEEIGF